MVFHNQDLDPVKNLLNLEFYSLIVLYFLVTHSGNFFMKLSVIEKNN